MPNYVSDHTGNEIDLTVASGSTTTGIIKDFNSLSGSATSTIQVGGSITASGNISGSSTSTGSFGMGYFDRNVGINSTATNYGLIVNTEFGSGDNNQIRLEDNGGEIGWIGGSTGGYLQIRAYPNSGNGSLGLIGQRVLVDSSVAGNSAVLGVNYNTEAFVVDKPTSVFGGHITASGNISSSGNIIVDGYISASGTLIGNAITLPDNAISGDTVEGGTIAAITITDLTATSLNVTHFTSSFITASTIITEGSNTFGDTIDDQHTFNGHITASGNISASGNVIAATGTFSQLGGALDVNNENITNIDINSGTVDGVIIGTNSHTSAKFTTINATSHITASGDISSSGFISTGTSITASGDISASGNGFFDSVKLNNGDASNMALDFQGSNPSGLFYDGTNFTWKREGSTALSFAIGNITFGGGGNSKISAVTNTSVTLRGGTTNTVFNTTGITTEGSISSSGAISTDLHITASGNISAAGNISASGVISSSRLYVNVDGSSGYQDYIFKVQEDRADKFTVDGGGNISVGGSIYASQYLTHTGDTDTGLELSTNTVFIKAGGSGLTIQNGHITASGDISASLGSTGSLGLLQIEGDDFTSASLASAIAGGGGISDGDDVNFGNITSSANISASRDSTLSVGTGSIQNDLTVSGDITGSLRSTGSFGNLVTGTIIIERGTDGTDRSAFAGNLYMSSNNVLKTDDSLHVANAMNVNNGKFIVNNSPIGPDVTVDGDLDITSFVTASGNISSSANFETLYTGSFGRVNATTFAGDGALLTSVPDYVFEPDYVLRKLPEVEQHISKSKHLPGIPSIDDREGWTNLSVSDRDMLLLEKVEELTLYVIDLQKQINELKNK
jgi:hypothetical protein